MATTVICSKTEKENTYTNTIT